MMQAKINIGRVFYKNGVKYKEIAFIGPQDWIVTYLNRDTFINIKDRW
jgi:hypothetical protein